MLASLRWAPQSFTEDKVRNNFTLLFELLDETMDFGYPQNTSVDVLKLYINLGKQRQKVVEDQASLTSQITGAIDWRREGIRHKRNEVRTMVEATGTKRQELSHMCSC